MALPATGYETGIYAAPASDVSSFSLIFDEANNTADYWTENDTADGSKGRTALNSDETELATDFIDFDNGAETGQRRIFIGNTFAAASAATRTLRFYPPVAANASYAAGDTYGSDNAYDANWEAYIPDGAGVDRTGNGNDFTPNSITPGDAAGQIGKATTYAGSPDYSGLASALITSYPGTIMAWMEPDNLTVNETMASLGQSDNASNIAGIRLEGTASSPADYAGAYLWTTTFQEAEGDTCTAEWQHVAGRYVSTTSRIVHRNAAAGVEDTANEAWLTATLSRIGCFERNVGRASFFEGDIQEVQFHSVARAVPWVVEEYVQTDDNAAFWTSRTWVPGAGGGAVMAAQYYRRVMQ